MYSRALVPLDGSTVAEAIIPFLLEIAGPLDMDVVLLRVLEPIPPTVLEGARHVAFEDVEGRRAQAEAYLAPIAQDLRSHGGLRPDAARPEVLVFLMRQTDRQVAARTAWEAVR